MNMNEKENANRKKKKERKMNNKFYKRGKTSAILNFFSPRRNFFRPT